MGCSLPLWFVHTESPGPLPNWGHGRPYSWLTAAPQMVLVPFFHTDRCWLQAGLEMLLIGALAAGVAYGIGVLGSSLTGGRHP